jgi:hypothetical protein
MKLNFTVSIEPLGKGHYSVPIRSGNKPYTVDLRIFHDTPGYESYSCPDFRRRHDTCLHRFAATIYRAKAPTRARGSGRGSRRPGRPQADGRIIYLLHFDAVTATPVTISGSARRASSLVALLATARATGRVLWK